MAPAFSRFSRRFSIPQQRRLVRTSTHLLPSHASLRTSRLHIAPYLSSQLFICDLGNLGNFLNHWTGSSENSLRARVMGYEKPRGAQRSAEKVGATEEIQSAEEGGSTLWKARARKRFYIHFSRSCFLKKRIKERIWSFGPCTKKNNEFIYLLDTNY